MRERYKNRYVLIYWRVHDIIVILYCNMTVMESLNLFDRIE